MSDLARPLISTGDFMVLQGLAAGRLADAPLSALLRQKLEDAVVLFSSDIGHEVVRIGSTVKYLAGDRLLERRLVAQGPADATSLPLLSHQGLALLGAQVGQQLEVLQESLYIKAVLDIGSSDAIALSPQPHQVIAFQRRQPMQRPYPVASPPDDDDPGPTAA
jgi:hypothetical protein